MSDTIEPVSRPNYSSIKERAQTINQEEISREILDWLIANVESYIDTQQTIYQIYFTKESISEMPQALALQQLYAESRAMENKDEEAEGECLTLLHNIVSGVKNIMVSDKGRLARLFERLIFYYDTKVQMDSKGNVIGKVTFSFDGSVVISFFGYETFTMEVEVKKGQVRGEEEVGEKTSIKKITMPEGYALEMKLIYWPATVSTSIF